MVYIEKYMIWFMLEIYDIMVYIGNIWYGLCWKYMISWFLLKNIWYHGLYWKCMISWFILERAEGCG
jgi:hypothetical protein